MLGYVVDQNVLNMRSAQAVLDLRSAFDQIENIAKWLSSHPNSGTDPLTLEPFSYSTDEAYVLRIFFETFETIRLNNTATFDIGRKMTGLQ